MKKILSVFMALCTVLTTLCIPPAPVTAQSTEMLISEPIDETVTLAVEEEPITLETLAEDCKILQYVDEEAFAAADHAFRLPDLEELDTYVFQNQDGTRSIYYLYENVKFYDEQGNIREKDNTLQRETKGFRITENEFDLLLPHAVTDGVELTYQGYDVKLIPAAGERLTEIAPGTLQENSVVYESFFGAGTSLVYTPLLSGVKEEIVLEEYLPNQSFSFLLYTDGLFLNNTNGSYILTESKASAEAVLYLGDIVVYDAVGRPSLGNLAVETVKDGNIYALTVSADEAFLSDPATVYPVTIDPDLTISDANNGSGAIEDTTLFSGTPNLNTGDWVYNTAGYVDDTYGAGRILVRLSGLYNSEVYQGLAVNNIKSCVFYCTRTSIKSTEGVKLYRASASWSESTATWNNFGNGSDYAASAYWSTATFNSTSVSFNISSLVRSWKRGTYPAVYGFVLVNDNETSASYKCGVYSSEHSNTEKRPYFVMTYEEDISLDKTELKLKIGTFGTLIATTAPAGGTVGWSSSNEAVATVDSGVVTANGLGSATITAIYVDSNDQPHTAECVVWVIPLAEGTYFLQNRQTGVYADVAAQIATAGALVQQWEFHGGATQKWKLTHVSNGYYTLHLENAGSMYYMGVEGNSQITDSNIVLRTGTVDDGMLWHFETTADGAYRIVPKLAEAQTTERALVATTSNNTNGDRLAYGNYVANNGSYRDEWFFCEQKDYSLMYIGVEVGDSEMPPIVAAVGDALRTVAEMDGYENTSLTKNEVLVHLSAVSVFSCITHGVQTRILATDDTISVADINSLSDSAFDELKFVYFGACETGKGKGAEVNLVNTVYNKGADAVLGFTINVRVNETNEWTKAFMIALAEGKTIESALTEADQYLVNEQGIAQLTTGPENRYLLGSDQLIPCE